MTLQLEMQDINFNNPTKVPEGYKWTEVGMIPDEWKVWSLGELGNFLKGRGIKRNDVTEDGLPCIRYGEIYTLYDNCVVEPVSFIPAYVANTALPILNGDLLFACSGETAEEIGKSVVYQGDSVAYAGGDIIVLRLLNQNSLYLGYLLNHPIVVKQKARYAQGDAIVHINARNLAMIRLALPTSEQEQNAIATALSDVDALIEALEKLIAKKRDIKLATMQQLLTGKTRLPGFSGEWDSMPLANVADKRIPFSFIGGPFGSNLKASEYTSSGVRIIQLQNIGDGVFYDDYAIYTSEKKADELYACNIYPGEIIIAKMGDPVARACIVPKQNKRYLMASDGIRLAVDKRDFSTRFVHDYINFSEFRNKAIEASTGSTRMRISLNKLKQLPFKAPKLKEQQAIATVFSDMDAELEALEQRLEKTKQIKQGMMQQLLTGRVRLV